eukprot:TRINITY_DN50692_c0_g1_i1.p2 TRINITY_DN50692_c0_g1~~TRINITY_DN50692_c0_g1_i1.p2  ORF type:complete len:129 (-),score=20.64 TRINITY_DN50692_c0_g1_i1:196-582(-)
MSWFGVDKLYHFIACAVLTAIAYTALGELERIRVCIIRNLCLRKFRIWFAMFVGMMVGLAKEIGDYWNLWPICPCSASAPDLAADFLGVLTCPLLVCLLPRAWKRRQIRSPPAHVPAERKPEGDFIGV